VPLLSVKISSTKRFSYPPAPLLILPDILQTRRYVAEWHCSHLFQSSSLQCLSQGTSKTASKSKSGTVIFSYCLEKDRVLSLVAQSVLTDTSNQLETLGHITGIESFFLAVDPADIKNDGFLGGTVAGREFWRGQRYGGQSGAKAFQLHCLKLAAVSSSTPSDSTQDNADTVASSSSPVESSSGAKVKAELYETFRNALRYFCFTLISQCTNVVGRATSGVRNAEMKWTSHSRLELYGVSIIGWPDDIPCQNPSTLKIYQNKKILQLFKDGGIKFIRIIRAAKAETAAAAEDTETAKRSNADVEGDPFVWAINDSYGDCEENVRLSSPCDFLLSLFCRVPLPCPLSLLLESKTSQRMRKCNPHQRVWRMKHLARTIHMSDPRNDPDKTNRPTETMTMGPLDEVADDPFSAAGTP
jgi:hypothetical protein